MKQFTSHYVQNLNKINKDISTNFMKGNTPHNYRPVKEMICDWINQNKDYTHPGKLKFFEVGV